MVVRFFILLVLVTFLGSFSVQAQESVAADSVSDYNHNLELETFNLINVYRESIQLSPFRWNAAIAEVARDHSRDMATGEVDFGHAGFHERVSKLGSILHGLKGAGENVFESDDPDQIAESAVALWLKSPPHLKNIRGDYNYSGLGVWEDKDGMVYFTQIFIKLKPVSETAQAAPQAPGLTTSFGFLAAPGTR